MPISTTGTTPRVRPRAAPGRRAEPRSLRPAWDCVNCATPNAGTRKRCSDCGTTRD